MPKKKKESMYEVVEAISAFKVYMVSAENAGEAVRAVITGKVDGEADLDSLDVDLDRWNPADTFWISAEDMDSLLNSGEMKHGEYIPGITMIRKLKPKVP